MNPKNRGLHRQRLCRSQHAACWETRGQITLQEVQTHTRGPAPEVSLSLSVRPLCSLVNCCRNGKSPLLILAVELFSAMVTNKSRLCTHTRKLKLKLKVRSFSCSSGCTSTCILDIRCNVCIVYILCILCVLHIGGIAHIL